MITRKQMMKELLKERLELVPKEWLPVSGWAKAWGLSYARAHRMLQDAMAAKPPLMERRPFKVWNSNTVRAVMHYREARKK